MPILEPFQLLPKSTPASKCTFSGFPWEFAEETPHAERSCLLSSSDNNFIHSLKATVALFSLTFQTVTRKGDRSTPFLMSLHLKLLIGFGITSKTKQKPLTLFVSGGSGRMWQAPAKNGRKGEMNTWKMVSGWSSESRSEVMKTFHHGGKWFLISLDLKEKHRSSYLFGSLGQDFHFFPFIINICYERNIKQH